MISLVLEFEPTLELCRDGILSTAVGDAERRRRFAGGAHHPNSRPPDRGVTAVLVTGEVGPACEEIGQVAGSLRETPGNSLDTATATH